MRGKVDTSGLAVRHYELTTGKKWGDLPEDEQAFFGRFVQTHWRQILQGYEETNAYDEIEENDDA